MANDMINYEALDEAASIYLRKAEEIGQIMTEISAVNGEVASVWQSMTAQAFVEQYDAEYVPVLERLMESLEEISTYMVKFAVARQEQDAATAGRMRGR